MVPIKPWDYLGYLGTRTLKECEEIFPNAVVIIYESVNYTATLVGMADAAGAAASNCEYDLVLLIRKHGYATPYSAIQKFFSAFTDLGPIVSSISL